MKRFPLRELLLICLPLLILAGTGLLLSRRAPLDVRHVSLLLNIDTPTNLESLEGSEAALTVALQGPQASRWELLSVNPHLQLETQEGVFDSLSSTTRWRNSWIRGTTQTRTLANLSSLPPGQLRYVCEAYIVSKEYPKDRPKRLSQSWLLNRATLRTLWAGKPRTPLLGTSKFTITRIGNRVWKGKKRRVVEGKLDFVVEKGGGPALDVVPSARPFEATYSASSPLPPGTTSRSAPLKQAFSLELGNQFVRARRLKVPVRVSGHANTGGRWPIAFQVEPFDFDKVQEGQQLKVKSWPVSR